MFERNNYQTNVTLQRTGLNDARPFAHHTIALCVANSPVIIAGISCDMDY